MFCANCGKEVNENAVVCVKCGAAVQNGNTNDPNRAVYAVDSFKKLAEQRILPWSLLSLGIVIFGAITLIFASNADDKQWHFKAVWTHGVLLTVSLSMAISQILLLVHRCWAIIQDVKVRTSPDRALGLLFIPLFNLYWSFIAIAGLGADMNYYQKRFGLNNKPVDNLLGILICVCYVIFVVGIIFWITFNVTSVKLIISIAVLGLIPVAFCIPALVFWIPFSYSLADAAEKIQEHRIQKYTLQRQNKDDEYWTIGIVVVLSIITLITSYWANYGFREYDVISNDSVKFAVFCGANINSKNSNGETLLHRAAGNDHLEVVKYLIEKGADVNVKKKNGCTPLHNAAYKGHLEVVEYLVEKGAYVNVTAGLYGTPLHQASAENRIKTAEYLIKNGAYVNAKNSNDKTPLGWAKTEEMKKLLRDAGGK
ncbi:MAG: ankyrin repeat domain-containing protein [Planctomycetaceae bacterium]|jgi:hypothetical protein|nr:ankyrin repeat domain-containing protein [Planctomycetaceae bacterium]